MTGTGKVTKIDGSLVTVTLKPSAACHGCGSTTCSSAGRGRDIVARNTHGIPLAPGDYAELTLPASRAVSALLRVFGLPVLAFAACYASVYAFGGGELLCIACGFGGCALGVAAAVVIGRRGVVLPEVLRGLPALPEVPAAES
ncbi:MAG: SoxR reducing system RseC family protein [Spirochaetaceae bacterium]|nr:SoxR reducing system RseC family protein [Spirochaetaceae bacterium]